MHRLFSLAAPALALALCFATPASAGVLISVDKNTQRMTVSLDGEKLWNWPVSTGRVGYATPSGRFTAFRLEQDHFSKEWDDAPMPHSIFFTYEGHAIHGSYETKNLGRPASHGCVRLAPQNAAKLFALVKEQGVSNTKVVVTGDSAPLVAKRKPPKESVQETAVLPADPHLAPGYGAYGYAAPYSYAPPHFDASGRPYGY